MRHIDHNTLELYVLESPAVQGRRRQISAHLLRCPDCQRIAKEISAFYSEAERIAGFNHIRRGESRRAVVPFRNETPAPAPERQMRTIEIRTGVLSVAASFFRSHPFAAGAGSVGILAAALLLVLNPFMKSTVQNPSYAHYDLSQDLVRIYSQDDRLLWEKPSPNLRDHANREGINHSLLTIVADLDRDGRNEVVTLLPPGTSTPDQQKNTLRVFSPDGRLESTMTLGHAVAYGGRSYPAEQFFGTGLATVTASGDGEQEIVSSAVNYRSPAVVTRASRTGEILGEYWHYGHIGGLYRTRGFAGGHDRVILIVRNDSNEERGDMFPAIIVLDPTKIRGRTESSATPGFGYEISSAEEFYVRIPGCDMYEAMHASPAVLSMMPDHGTTFRFVVSTPDARFPMFEYRFSQDFSLQAVLSMDGGEAVHDSLSRIGLISSTYDKAYLASLGKMVMYWDGRAWGSRAVQVRALPPRQGPLASPVP